MKKESFMLLIELYQDIQEGVRDTLDLLIGGCVSSVGYNEGFLGKLTRIESVLKNECHPSFLAPNEEGCAFYSEILDDPDLSIEEKVTILMNPRN